MKVYIAVYAPFEHKEDVEKSLKKLPYVKDVGFGLGGGITKDHIGANVEVEDIRELNSVLREISEIPHVENYVLF